LDKFPEAFRRFENVVDVERIRTLRELELAFGSWAGHKWKPTLRQSVALAYEARRLRIPIRPQVPSLFTQKRETPTWRVEYIKVRGTARKIYRNTKTGQFIKTPVI